MSDPRFEGGSPLSDPDNPFSRGAWRPNGVLPSLPVEQHHAISLGDLDGFDSEPITSDNAADRPLNPPTIGGDVGVE